MIDGGACVGKIVEEYINTHTVFAFEPNLSNFRALDYRYKCNNNARLFRAALGKTAGKTSLLIPGHISAHPCVSATIISENRLANNLQSREEVDVINLSQFCREQGIDAIDVLNLDIEGAEYEVLDDLLDSGLIQKIRAIYVEFHAKACIPSLLETEAKLLSRLAEEYHGELYIYNWDKGCYE
jgi:FkbM family methyltransferase